MLTTLARRAAAVIGAFALVAAATVPSVAVEEPASALTFMGGGEWPLGYETKAFVEPVHTVRLEQASDGATRERFEMVVGGQRISRASLSIEAPETRPRLVPGRYTVRAAPTADDAVLRLFIDHAGCTSSEGSFDVLAVTRSADGRLASLALDYSVSCDHQGPGAGIAGSLRWNTDVAYGHTAVTGFHAPAAGLGVVARGEVRLTNLGSVPQTYGRATWLPQGEVRPGPSPVAIERDGCAGVTLAPWTSCTIAVGIRSDGISPVSGYLRAPDGTPRGAAYAPVLMRVGPEPGPPAFVATPERGAVRLSSSVEAATFRVLRAVGEGPEVVVAESATMPWTDTAVTVGTAYLYRVVPIDEFGREGDASDRAVTGPLPVPVGAEGTFVPIDPVRVLDTRDGTGGRRGALGAGATLRFDPAVTGDIPRSGVEAVLLNVTGTEATTVTHVRAWPAGDPRPETSSLNLVPGQNRPNQVVVPLGADGEVELYNNAGSTHLVVDLQGFYSAADGVDGGGYHPTTPARVLDTRLDDFPLGPGEEVWLPVSAPGVEWSQVTAVDVNLTVTQPSTTGHLTAWPGDLEAPLVSNANFLPGQTVANHAVVPVSFDESGEPGIAVRNSAGETHLVVDVQGWYDDGTGDGLRFATSPTLRVLDTRLDGGPVLPGETVAVRGRALPPGVAHVANVTATGSSGAGHLTVWSGVGTLPPTSSLNFARNEDAPNLATALAGPDGGFAVTAGTNPVHVVVDHLGFFY